MPTVYVVLGRPVNVPAPSVTVTDSPVVADACHEPGPVIAALPLSSVVTVPDPSEQ